MEDSEDVKFLRQFAESITGIFETIKTLREEIIGKDSLITDLNAKMDSLNEDMNLLKSDLTSQKKKITKLEKDLNNSNKRIEALKETNKKLNSEIADIRAKQIEEM